jgi:hypothetical protein
MDEHTCAHEACTCAVEGDARYCSPECESAGTAGGNGDDCTCGHPDCV